MEPAGLAVGIVGLAGVYSACIDVLSRVQSYKSFQGDSKTLSIRFEGAKVRLGIWADKVGIKLQNNELANETDEPNHAAPKNSKLRLVVKEHLTIIEKLFCPEESLSQSETSELLLAASRSKRHRLGWALAGKEIRKEHVAAFETLVQNLHDLIPPDSQHPVSEIHTGLSGVEDVHAMLSEMLQEAACEFCFSFVYIQLANSISEPETRSIRMAQKSSI